MTGMMRWVFGVLSLMLCCIGTLTLVASFELRVEGGRHGSFLPLYAVAAMALSASAFFQFLAIRKSKSN
jgi:hypothetical protein